MPCACHTFTTSTFCHHHFLCVKHLPLINFKQMKSCSFFKIQPKKLSVCPSPKHSLPLSLSSLIPPFILSCITYSNHDLRLVGRLAQHSVGYTFECLQHINIGKSLENSLEKLYLPWEKLFCKPLSHKIYICK